MLAQVWLWTVCDSKPVPLYFLWTHGFENPHERGKYCIKAMLMRCLCFTKAPVDMKI